MQTKQIPRNEWSTYLNNFSSRHHGWFVNIEILGEDIGAQVEGIGLVLEGVTDEWDEVKGHTIMIMAGNKPEAHLTHLISRPTEITVEKTETGEDVAFSIKGEDGIRTLLVFPR